jgi:hypothetical protein
MAKAPSKAPTKAGMLRELKSHGMVSATTKTFNKSAQKVWADYREAFPNGASGKQAFLAASKEARAACASVNMRIIGNAVVFPKHSDGWDVKLRETKRGVFVEYGPKKSFKTHSDTIILSKDGNHIKYGVELARRNKAREGEDITATYGTVKTHAYSTGKKKDGTAGEMINGFMRDTARATENPLDALLDNRYSVDSLNLAAPPKIDKGFISKLAQTNGVAALIRVRM